MCRLTRSGGTMEESSQCDGEITWGDQPDTQVEITTLSRTYARGSVAFTHAPAGVFHVSVLVPMQEYLYGLAEVPNSWHLEALKAQAVAARTFALYRIRAIEIAYGGLNPACACHVYSSTVDQAYRGWYTSPTGDMTEGGPNGSNWKQAVDQTEGKAMWHASHGPTRALEAYYFSSTGDNTENSEDKWNFRAYLRSVDDPGARPWNPPTKTFSYADFAEALDFDMVTWVEIEDRYDSGRPVTIEVQGLIDGSPQTVDFTSSDFLSKLGLQSQWIWSIQGFIPPGAARVVLHNPGTGQWSYRAADGSISTIYYGNPGDQAFMGDWNCDGVETPGLYRQSDGYVYLRDSNTQGVADVSFF
ncbi:MAG: SpoIID/LytB domain-containing protein, partial [Actinobacteria bacterium]|nr:SpoIID/LytB domain-containing protein [Actinomycetota bacterium]